jgi:hypothetical protein
MQRLSKWKRHSKGFEAPLPAGPAKAPSRLGKWLLEPDRMAEIVMSDTSPVYWLEFSNGKKMVRCTFDHYDGRPRLVGEAGLARLTEAGNVFYFSFVKPEQPLDLAAIKAAAAEYRRAIGAPEHRKLSDRAAHSNPEPHVPMDETIGRPRLKGYAAISGFTAMDSIGETRAKVKVKKEVHEEVQEVVQKEVTTVDPDAAARNQGMLDFYSSF